MNLFLKAVTHKSQYSILPQYFPLNAKDGTVQFLTIIAMHVYNNTIEEDYGRGVRLINNSVVCPRIFILCLCRPFLFKVLHYRIV